ncbi:MAG: hypothetical protein QXF25_00540, partial [Candidatus Pacearchaeota archaeon]
FFLFLGVGLVSSFKITLFFSYVLSGIFILAFAKEFFKDFKKAFLVSIFYQFATFRIIDVTTRGAFGEAFTYTFLPLLLLGLTYILNNKIRIGFLVSALSAAFLVLSHNSISLVFFTISILFILFFAKRRNHYILTFSSLIIGLFLSSFYWIPAVLEHKYTYGDLFMKNMYLSHFADLGYLFIPNFVNSPNLWIGHVPVQIGLVHTLAIIVAIFILFSSRKNKNLIIKVSMFSLIIFFSSLFFMLPISSFLWERISMLRQFQFPWRFLTAVVISASFASSQFLVFDFFKKKWIYSILIITVIFLSIPFWQPQEGYDKIDENYYWNYPLNTTYSGETDVIWSAGPAKSYPKQRVEVISGDGEIKDFYKKSNLHTFTVNAKSAVTLVDHTQYFPGWRVHIDGEPTEIEFQDINYRGEIEFKVPKGQHKIRVSFGESKIRLFADLLSFFGLVILFIFWLFSAKVRLQNNINAN